MSHIDQVRSEYEAFLRGDVPTILASLDDDIVWGYGSTTTDVPWLQPRRGREEVARFFQIVQERIEFRKFEPKTYLESGDTVVALLDVEFVVKATGQVVSQEDEAHIFKFKDGKVARFGVRTDTHRHVLAYHGELAMMES